MDEDAIQPPSPPPFLTNEDIIQPPPPPPFQTENAFISDNNDDIFPYFLNSSLLFPSTSQNQYYPTNGPLLTQNSQIYLENIDWISTMLNGKPKENRDQMPPSPCVPVLASTNNTSNIGSGGGDCQNNCINKRRGASKTKKPNPPRVAFHTRSSEDILDDGYKWRKYGQKSVKHSKQPRCTHHTCNVKKQIQRLSKDNSVVVTTYEGIHNHPCEKLMETLSPLLRQLQFLSRF
ncbi:putative WRKY transcription factor 51 isoform X2 [Apium graveolens]|uniref:putative WRKY transcription factor 51 isoform X2 n=1 Tax=Apium graveolens TaxID=4045 RepID=UPI003D7ACB1E